MWIRKGGGMTMYINYVVPIHITHMLIIYHVTLTITLVKKKSVDAEIGRKKDHYEHNICCHHYRL